MFTSTDLKSVITEARPIMERQLDDATLIAGFREAVTAKGGDWSQVKALVKAMIQDERDEAGGHKRVLTILHKAGNALGYADMLGLGNLNEKNSFADGEEFDPETGEITEGVDSTDALLCSGGAEAARQVHTLEVAGASPAPATNPVANVGEEANGAIAAASVDPASRVADDADRQRLADTGFTGDAAVVSPKLARDASDEPGHGAPAATIPTPAGGGNTTEPDSGLAPSGDSEVAAEPERSGLTPADPLRSEAATRKDAETTAPAKRQWKFNDPAHLDCLNPDQCGGLSNQKLCPGCAAEALSARQVA